MLTRTLLELSPRQRLATRVCYSAFLIVMIVVSFCIVQFLAQLEVAVVAITEPIAEPFPLGVDPAAEVIIEQPTVEAFLNNEVAFGPRQPVKNNWWDRLLGEFASREAWQSLALASSRVLVIYAGERHEEVADNFAGILRWSADEKWTFIQTVQTELPYTDEGVFLPGKYVVSSDATPEVVARLLIDGFKREVVRRYPEDIATVVPLEDALIIASLLEREAYDFTDMREISGVIWNRLFIDMPLQLDATLQYAKGSSPVGPWWPKPRSADKYIDSPYNTYQNDGLPPGPISNPSVESILAALNPIETDCLFYLHAAGGAFYCAETYDEHRANINTYLR